MSNKNSKKLRQFARRHWRKDFEEFIDQLNALSFWLRAKYAFKLLWGKL